MKASNIRKTNNQAYDDLVLLCTDNTSFDLIDSVCIDQLPDGDLALAFQDLSDFWEPKTKSCLTKLIKKYELSSLESVKDDPMTDNAPIGQ